MTINDILEIEQLKYCYEQAYSLHRHRVSPQMFTQREDTVFTLPSASDYVTGWEAIRAKFCGELYDVAPQADSYHTGWQICVPVIWENEKKQVCGIFPTFGYLALNMAPEIMKPPYQVLSTQELWYDRFFHEKDRWSISYLQAQFLIGQAVWRWDIEKDDGCAVKKELQEIPHPCLAARPFSGSPACGPHIAGGEGVSNWDKATGKSTLSGAYYGIQFAMSLYTLLWQCGRMDELVDRVFTAEEGISVSYEGQVSHGREAVREFFAGIKEETVKNGGFLRMDMPATQSVIFSEDGKQAEGRWLTKTSEILPAPGGNQYQVSIGTFSILFLCEEGIWKMKRVQWEPLQRFAPYRETPDANLEAYRKNPGAWLSELPVLKKLPAESIESCTAETLDLRNRLMNWLYQFHEQKDLTEGIRCKDVLSLEQMKKLQENCAFLLVTSPVIRMKEDLSLASAFFSVSKIKENSDGTMTHIRGGLYLELDQDAEDWSISRFAWYPYASLEPWKKKSDSGIQVKNSCVYNLNHV